MGYKAVIVGTIPIFGTATFTIYSASDDQNLLIFNFDGSSSMKPFMEFLLDKYSEQLKKPISFNISAIGSNSGLKKLLSGSSEFALVSHDVSKLHQDEKYKEIWKSKQIKSLSLAQEAIVFLYLPPKECTEDLVLSASNIKKIYSLFSGYQFPQESISQNLKDLIDGSPDECNVQVYPWVKSTGPSKSGTAKAFIENPLLNSICGSGEQECEKWKENIKNGYGNDFSLNYASESTNLHWDSFSKNLRPGTMTYLPSHFVLKNLDLIKSYGVKFAKFKKTDSSSAIELTQDFKIEDYDWRRQFNLVFSTSNLSTNQEKKNLLEFLVTKNQELSQLHVQPITYKINGQGTGTEIDLCKGDSVTT